MQRLKFLKTAVIVAALGLPFVLVEPAFAADGDVAKVENFIKAIIAVITGLADLIAVIFIIMGGMGYMTSSGNPDKLEHAKKIIKNALIGLALVLAAATLTAILSHAYSSSGATPAEKFPTLQAIEPTDDGTNFWDVLISGRWLAAQHCAVCWRTVFERARILLKSHTAHGRQCQRI